MVLHELGWEQPCSHGTAVGLDPLRMLQPDYQGRACSLAPGGTLLCPPQASLMHHHGISSSPWLGRVLQGVCWQTRHSFSGSVLCSHQEEGKTKHRIRPPHREPSRVLALTSHSPSWNHGRFGVLRRLHATCDTMSLSHIAPSPLMTAGNGQTRSRLQFPCWIHTQRNPGSLNSNLSSFQDHRKSLFLHGCSIKIRDIADPAFVQ